MFSVYISLLISGRYVVGVWPTLYEVIVKQYDLQENRSKGCHKDCCAIEIQHVTNQ